MGLSLARCSVALGCNARHLPRDRCIPWLRSFLARLLAFIHTSSAARSCCPLECLKPCGSMVASRCLCSCPLGRCHRRLGAALTTLWREEGGGSSLRSENWKGEL
jgi:hypothetical protein